MTRAGVERSAARIPGTARIAPMLTTGFDGASSTTSAVSIDSGTPGPALAVSATTDAQQSRARRPPMDQRRGHLRQRIACAQHLGADGMGGQIGVAKAEPVRLHAIGREFLLGVPGFVATSPPAFGVDAGAEGVHAGV